MADLRKKHNRLADVAVRTEKADGFKRIENIRNNLFKCLTGTPIEDGSHDPLRPVSGFPDKLAFAMKILPLQIALGISISIVA